MSAEEITSGLRLGRYELLVPIAKGGTASVWAARMKGPRGFEKIVAAKVMLAEFGENPDAETMFLDEARTVSRIRHPNVAEVLDLGEEGDALFLVMEWIDGEPLHVIAREARARGGVPLPIVGHIARQICAGLHAAHDLRDAAGAPVGLVHRDVSPQNILVGYDGLVKVIDFGVAKAASNQMRTSVGQIKGKVAYMAPEQAYGEPVDRRTDVFALGIVLYALVTGKHPFRGDNEFATLGRIRDKRPVDPLSVYLPDVPDEVEQVILTALAKPRDQRYPDMLAFQRALEEAFPPLERGTEALAEYMTALLGPRGEEKRQAIRDARQHAEEHQPTPTAVPAAFDAARNLDPDEGRGPASTPAPMDFAPGPVGLRAATPSPPGESVPVTAPPRGGLELPPPSEDEGETLVMHTKRAPAAQVGSAPGAWNGPSGAEVGLPVPDFRPKRLGVKIVAAVVVLALAVGLAIWGASDDGSSPPDSGTPAGKKPW